VKGEKTEHFYIIKSGNCKEQLGEAEHISLNIGGFLSFPNILSANQEAITTSIAETEVSCIAINLALL